MAVLIEGAEEFKMPDTFIAQLKAIESNPRKKPDEFITWHVEGLEDLPVWTL